MSAFEYQNGRQFHVWQKISATVRVYRGVFCGREPLAAAVAAMNRHGNAVTLVKESKFGRTLLYA